MRPAAADTAGSSPSPAVPRPGSAPTARRRCCRALHGWRPARGRAARSPDGHRLARPASRRPRRYRLFRRALHLRGASYLLHRIGSRPWSHRPRIPRRARRMSPLRRSARMSRACCPGSEFRRVEVTAGCVRVPGASAGGPDGGAAGGPGVGAVRRGRSPAASRRCRACMPTWSRGGIAGAGQPGAAWPADAAGGRARRSRTAPLVRVPRTLPRILPPREADRLVGALRTHRDRAMVLAMVLAGLRRCAVLGLRLRTCRSLTGGWSWWRQGRPSPGGPGREPVLRRARRVPA